MDDDTTAGLSRRSIIGMTGAALVLPAVPATAQTLEARRMQFTPIFIDLVRNYTTTTGTGNLVLGDPAPGFKSFTSVLKAGDTFYYSVAGLDHVGESEVGRGTLQPDGSIARDPINGVPTNFSKGLKSVALVTAAEWFAGAASKDELNAAMQFKSVAAGSVQRPLATKVAEIVSVGDFGAVADGVTDDSAALAAAVAHGVSTGQAIFVPKGTYLVDPGALQIDGAAAERFVMFGEGASSILKIRDNGIVEDDSRMFLIQPSSPMDVIEFRDLMVDMNARGSPAPADPWAYQHSHAFCCQPSALVKMIRFQNVVIKDPAADGFNFQATAGEDLCTYFVVDNCAVIDRTRVRSDIECSRLPKNLLVTGFVGEVIEAEPTAVPTTKKRIQLSNCNLKRIDVMSSNPADVSAENAGLVEVEMSNVLAPTSCVLTGVKVRASNCVLGVRQTDSGFNRFNNLGQGSRFSQCEFRHDYGASGNVTPLWIFCTYKAGRKSGIAFDGCDFVIDAASPFDALTAGTNSLVELTAGCPAAEMADHRVEFADCRFDSRAYRSIKADRCGTVVARNCRFGGTDAAVYYASGPTYGVDLSIEGGDYSGVSGAMIAASWSDVDQASAKAYLRLRGDCAGYSGQPLIANVSSSPTAARSQSQIKSARRILGGSPPATGLLGDVFELDGSALAAGAADSYRCTESSASAATWKPRTVLAG